MEFRPGRDGEHDVRAVGLAPPALRRLGLSGAALAAAAALALSGAALGCGSGHQSPVDNAPPPDALADAPVDARPGFSDAVRAEFHLVPDGQISDGRLRMLYAPKVAWLDRFGANPRLTRAEPSGGLLLNGTFSLVTPGVAALVREATAANVALVRADLGMAHVTCGSTAVLTSLSLRDGCNQPATVVSLPGGVAFSAGASVTAAPEASARITAHLDGGAWDDVLVGDIAWETPGGDVLHTKLAVDCIGGFRTTGDALVADTAECKARYQP